MINVCEYLVWG